MHRTSVAGLGSVPTDSDSDDVKQGLPRDISARANADDGGKEVAGGTEGSHIRPSRWMEGEYFDARQAKSGEINPDKGEQYFSPDDEDYHPRTDRSYRAGSWAAAGDVHDGSVVSMPYMTS